MGQRDGGADGAERAGRAEAAGSLWFRLALVIAVVAI